MLVPFKAEHLLTIILQPGQLDEAFLQNEAHAKALESRCAFTVFAGGRPVAVFGAAELWENRAQVWAFIDENAGPHFATIHRHARQLLAKSPWRRLEIDVNVEFDQGHRWAKMLGFELEAPRMKAFRPDGGDSSLYSKVT